MRAIAQNRHKNTGSAAILVALALLTGGSIALCESAFAMGPNGTHELDLANHAYITGDFERGVQYVDLHLRKLPNDGAAHYLKANCLMKLARLTEASREYAYVMKLAPESVISNYSKDALKRIEAMPPEQRSVVEKASSSANVSNGSASPRARSAGSKKVPPGTLELIRFQAARAKEHAMQSGEAAAKDERLKASSQGKSEKDRVERLSASNGQRGDHPPLSAAELQAMQERAARNAEILKQIGDAKAARKEQEAHEKAVELQRQAEDLERQLTDDNYNKHRDIKLNPVGTNLYVRNYSKIAPTVKPMRAQAQTLDGSITGQQTSAQLRNSNGSATLKTNTTGQGAGSLRRETKVRGEVIPH